MNNSQRGRKKAQNLKNGRIEKTNAELVRKINKNKQVEYYNDLIDAGLVGIGAGRKLDEMNKEGARN